MTTTTFELVTSNTTTFTLDSTVPNSANTLELKHELESAVNKTGAVMVDVIRALEEISNIVKLVKSLYRWKKILYVLERKSKMTTWPDGLTLLMKSLASRML